MFTMHGVNLCDVQTIEGIESCVQRPQRAQCNIGTHISEAIDQPPRDRELTAYDKVRSGFNKTVVDYATGETGPLVPIAPSIGAACRWYTFVVFSRGCALAGTVPATARPGTGAQESPFMPLSQNGTYLENRADAGDGGESRQAPKRIGPQLRQLPWPVLELKLLQESRTIP